jgi:hypothetical protein
MPLFLTFYFFNNHSYSNIHAFILHHLTRSIFLYLLTLLSATEASTPQGAEPIIEFGPALQQADALPIELRRTLRINHIMVSNNVIKVGAMDLLTT